MEIAAKDELITKMEMEIATKETQLEVCIQGFI